MQINTNGKRNIILDFDAPRKFKLKKDGAEIPYIRTGKNSFRLGRNIDGVLDLEEVIEQPRIVKPMQLQAQQMVWVNSNDVLMINQAAQQLEIEQNILGETQKRAEQTQAYLDIQQQKINETVLIVQGLENNNAERITATENGIFNLAGNLATTEQNLVDGIGAVNNELNEHKTAENPHGITKETIGLNKVDNTSDLDKPISKAVQSALDEKADKDEIQAIRDELGEYQEKNDRFTNALSNYTGGLAGNQLPDGGLEGQILAKRSDMSGDAEWVDSSASITIDDELSLESENPVQNKVITSNITALQTSKQDVISDLATIRSGSALGATAVQPSELESYATKDYVDGGLSGKQDKLTQTQLDAVNSGANTTNIGHIATNTSDIADINALIPNQATTQNQLADKSFVNSSINNIAAFYITSDVAGDPFTTREALIAGPYYFRGEIRTPTQNDYALVSEDETHDDLTSRFMYDGGQWVWQYTLNNTKFTQAQIDAINSGITNGLVAKISTNETTINNHIANTSNPHSVTKAQVGLGNVDNTSDLNKPISTATQTALNGKQATLVSGTNIKTINNQPILGSGNIDIQSGSSYTSGTGINITNDVISVEGVKDQNNVSQAIKTWTGTLAQYNAIATKDNNTLYNITDDNTAVAYQAYSKSETDTLISTALNNTLSTLYPVGSIYIGTQSTCPLASLISGSTWVKVSEGRVLQGSDSGHSAGTTIAAGLPNITGTFNNTVNITAASGAFYTRSVSNSTGGTNTYTVSSAGAGIDASRSSSIYGNASTVQPPAFVVNIWKRTA